ncbi:MAG: tyrosine-type recombinase/integrase [Pseudomonadota bacterium]
MGKHTLNKLSATGIKNKSERGYYADGGGLYFRISAFDTRSWAFRFTMLGKSREMGLGAYPDVTLMEARERAADARRLLRDGVDPIEARKATRSATAAAVSRALTFAQCADAYIAKESPAWKNSKHEAQWRSTLEAYAYPVIGKMLVRDVTEEHILKILEPIWLVKTETASRVRGRIESVLDYATAKKYRSGDNPARWRGFLDKHLPKPKKVAKVKHHPALPYAELGAFMPELKAQEGMGARALEFAILTAARSGEVRGATWGEIDLDAATWTIPASRMKAEKEHRVALSAAAIKLLKALPRIDGSDLLFPSSKNTPLSDMTLTAVLRRMGRSDITAHGFRSTFRDWAGETTAYPREVIEHALAHQLKDKAEAAYARGTLFEKRRKLMEAWGKYATTKRTPASVTPIRAAS